MTFPQTVRHAAASLLASADASLPDALIAFLQRFVGRPYVIRTSALKPQNGPHTDAFACVVFRGPTPATETSTPDPIPAACATTVIDACENLSLEDLRAAYLRTATAKQIQQSAPCPHGDTAYRNELLSVVFALRSDLTLSTIANEVRRLNERTSATQWPDIVAVANTGLIQYAAQFPGETTMGDFFLPNALHSQPIPVYVVMGIRPTAEHTLNRMLALIVAHLALSVRTADVPPYREIVDGIPNTCTPIASYQFDLAGKLKPYSAAHLPPRPFTIQDNDGRAVATVQFLPWQDGGVIRSIGQFPLETLLLFLGP